MTSRRTAVFLGRLLGELFRLTPTGSLLTTKYAVGPPGLMPALAGIGAGGIFIAHGHVGPALASVIIGLGIAASHVALARRERRRREARHARHRAEFAARLGDGTAEQ